MFTREEYLEKAHTVNDAMKAQLNHKSLKYNWHDADVSVLEGVLARGDRRVGAVILDAYKRGCLFDSGQSASTMKNGWRPLRTRVSRSAFIT